MNDTVIDRALSGKTPTLSSAKNVFEIGVSMSGAISAGAYTAGVFDFLIQALDEWERKKTEIAASLEKGEITVEEAESILPRHSIGLKVLTGASAGAITAAIGVLAIATQAQAELFTQEEQDQLFPSFPSDAQKVKSWLPKLYDAWVVRPSLLPRLSPEGKRLGSGMLETFDIQKRKDAPKDGGPDYFAASEAPAPNWENGKPLCALLNTTVLDEIAENVLKTPETSPPRSYVSQTLHLYMTLGNLRGTPYSITFGNSRYGMLTHGDRAHFRVQGLGSWNTSSVFADNDYSILLQKDALKDANAATPTKGPWRDFAVCALASSAFPIGLSPRLLALPFNDYRDRLFPEPTLADRQVQSLKDGKRVLAPHWPEGTICGDSGGYSPFITVDGGVINNDPFEYARFTLMEQLGAPNERDVLTAMRAVIMVAPFPDPPQMLTADKPDVDIISILRALIPAWKNQARFKLSELVLALDPDVGSRFMISPVRDSHRYKIASGGFGGFGGFFARQFRDHDFQLGRRNCQAFLRRYFALPQESQIFAGWRGGEMMKGMTTVHADTMQANCLLPLFGSANDDVPEPRWPYVTQAEFETLMEFSSARFDAVVKRVVDDKVKFWPLRYVLKFALRWRAGGLAGRNWMLSKLRYGVESELLARGQIAFANGSAVQADEKTRAVLSALIDPNFDLRTPSRIAASLSLDPGVVVKILDDGGRPELTPYDVWKTPWTADNGEPLYTSELRRPARWKWLLLKRWTGRDHYGPLGSAPSIG
ncbi:patatin-like phospholipase family protein [Methylocystis sp. 9N]|uniref:Patatin-like phospholipase family protein n=1 Tax=Methylocystis borbori TaxID=3118750 RepID=A0ABU7XFV5_9HYPH